MQEESSSLRSLQSQERIKRIRKAILDLDHVCSGTLVTSRITCGKPNCRCANDPESRHGPYHQWNRMKAGKLVHSTVTPRQVDAVRSAIVNYRAAQKLLRKWEEETAKIIGIQRRRR